MAMLRIVPPAMNSAPKPEVPVSPLADDKIGREDRSALVCCHEPAYQEYLAVQLREMHFKVHHATGHQQATHRLTTRLYDVIVLLENLEACALEDNALLNYLKDLRTDDRRQIYVIMLCGSFATGDAMHAYAQSVDLLINYQDISQFAAVTLPAIDEHEEGNRFFKAALIK